MLRGLRLPMARPLLARMGLNTIHTTAIVRAQTIVPRPPPSERVKPTSPAYFTTKPSYIDTLLMLDQLTREIKRELEQCYILPSNSKPPPLPQGPTNIWVSREILKSRLGINLRASQFRSIISRLTLLLRYRALVIANFTQENSSMFSERSTTQQKQLAQKMEEVFATFMSSHGKAQDAQKKSDAPPRTSTRGFIDEQGRAYARGRRKESSARIWLVPAKNPDLEIGEVLVNGTPLSQYFTRAVHREQVVWPLKLAGVLGQFNIFALTRSGGQTGQAGAVAHGIANALVAQLASAQGAEAQSTYERVKLLLSKDGILNRDPRMVERKKPGLAKARKAFTWVKR
ncbi:37S ribosomal protein S9, mitochondrial [Malassezia psittaci]|uniref:Small ribosomal subunit protein uS9m n=1 Tax=Malassezia psittaci TaxID=1821823 RepID=A0AAF0F7T7_9BASI|nr:37S ribosomal protein S9, mitochondrial [Malassezia psittaci]